MTLLNLLETLLVIGMLGAALFVVRTRDLLAAVVVTAIISLVAAILFYVLQAPDVAITEAAIDAGLTTAIFLVALRKTERYEK